MAFIGQTSLLDTSAANTRIQNVTCDATVYIGAAVRMNSSGVAINAIANSFDNSNVIGIVEEKASSTICTIRFLGVTLEGIYSGLDTTKEYFLSAITPGEITTTIPTASGHVVLKVGQPFSSSRFLVLKGQRMERA